MLATTSAAGKPDQESQKLSGQSRGINTRQTVHLSDPEGAGSELAGDACLPLDPCIALRVLATFCKLLILAEENSSTFVPQDFAILYLISDLRVWY